MSDVTRVRYSFGTLSWVGGPSPVCRAQNGRPMNPYERFWNFLHRSYALAFAKRRGWEVVE